MLGMLLLTPTKTRAAESESKSESNHSVSVIFLRVGSRQSLTTPTDSWQAFIPDSQKSPFRLFDVFFLPIFLWWTGWMMGTEPSPALLCTVAWMTIGRIQVQIRYIYVFTYISNCWLTIWSESYTKKIHE